MKRKKHIAPATGVPVQPANDQGAVYSVSQVAKRWGVHRHTVTALIKKGELHAFLAGERQYRIRAVDLVHYETEKAKAAS